FFFQAEDGIRDRTVTGVQTCALPICPRPWRDFAVISLCEWTTAAAAAIFCSRRIMHITSLELFVYCFLAATLMRYILRKEFLQDIRGLRRDLPQEAGRESRTGASDLRRLRDAA